MPVKARFQLDRLPVALRNDLREKLKAIKTKEPGRYLRATMRPSCGVFYARYREELIARLIDQDSTLSQLIGDTTYEPVSDELNAALVLNDEATIRHWEPFRTLVAHVAEGHYTAEIVERLRSLCELNRLHEAEAILASVPPRDSSGPLVTWVEHSLRAFTDAHISLLIARQEIIRVAEAEGGEP